jgi:putative glycosyltransferase
LLIVRLSIVSTLYQSAPHLEEFYRRVRAAASLLTDDFEIVLVNDGSPDDSLGIALSLFRQDPHVRVVDLARNFGHHKAMMTGLARASGDLVLLIDSDLEEDPELLNVFHQTLLQTGADVIYGVQAERRGSLAERAGGWLFFRIFNALSDSPISANLVTLRLMTRRYVAALIEHRERETMIAGLWAITGFTQVAVPIRKHAHSTSTYRLTDKIAILVNSVTSFSDKPLVLIFYLGLIIVSIASSAAAYLVVRRLFFGQLLAGWPSLIVSVWLLGGLTLFCLGIIGMYVSKVFVETKQRPYTIIRQTYERPIRSGDAAVSTDARDGRSILF